MCFLNLKSVRSCALILKPNSVRWWERAHLCVRARVCVCVCVRIEAELCHARYKEQRIVNARPCRDRNFMPSCKQGRRQGGARGGYSSPWISHSTPKKIMVYLLLLFNLILRSQFNLLCDNNISITKEN